MYAETVVEDHLSGCTGDIDIKYLYDGAYGQQPEELWKSKIRMIEKIEQEHPQDVGTVEVWDGEKKRVYYGLVTIGNDGSNGERVRVMLDGVLRSEEKCE